MTEKRTIRCAVYTRKSTEEGLDQAFNSLDAQREACSAYVKSQVGEGWLCIGAKYDDGGFSGGNMERPGLHRLLSDIDQGKIDCVVVYKIDRLTRSLADFAKIVERFAKRNVSFVSVTQSFNTTTSMGRLTLNVLLSFAQFEREVTAERIRDKFTASRAKGIFMGGNPPLGYDARERKLQINEAEAKIVRTIFKRYLELGSIGELRYELEAKGVRSKCFVSTRGKSIGGGKWYVGPLRHVLRNPVYIGLAVHKGKTYPGQHKAIIAKPLFEKVQAQLSRGARTWQRQRTIEASGLLTGLIYDDKGNRMSPQWSVGRSKTRHLYYVSQALLQRREGSEGSLPRVAAPLVEDLVVQCVRALQPTEVHNSSPTANGTFEAAAEVRQALVVSVHEAVVKVIVNANETVVEFRHVQAPVVPKSEAKKRQEPLESRLPAGASVKRTAHGVQVTIPGRLKRYGGIKRVEGWTRQDWSVVTPRLDKSLVAALVRAHRWRDAIERGDITSIDHLAASENLHRRRVREVLRIAFLAPDIQRAILEGRQPSGLNLERLSELGPPAAWSQQRKLLGLGT